MHFEESMAKSRMPWARTSSSRCRIWLKSRPKATRASARKGHAHNARCVAQALGTPAPLAVTSSNDTSTRPPVLFVVRQDARMDLHVQAAPVECSSPCGWKTQRSVPQLRQLIDQARMHIPPGTPRRAVYQRGLIGRRKQRQVRWLTAAPSVRRCRRPAAAGCLKRQECARMSLTPRARHCTNSCRKAL